MATSISKTSTKVDGLWLRDGFEIVPADEESANKLAGFYGQLKVVLVGFYEQRLSGWFEKGLKAFYLSVISKMREVNLNHHYLFTQIVDHGVENRVTQWVSGLKMTKYGCLLLEAFFNMVQVILILLETEKKVIQDHSIQLNCREQLIDFGSSRKGIIEDLLNLSIFLQEKGEPFKIQILKLAKIYLEAEGYIENLSDSKLFARIGTFAIDTIASKKLTPEFLNTYSTLLSFDLLNDLITFHSFPLTPISTSPSPDLSSSALTRIQTFSSLGWLTRFIHHRSSLLRVSCWNTLTSWVSQKLLKTHPSLVEESLECFLNEKEVYAAKIASIGFFTKVCEVLMATEGFMEETEEGVDMGYVIKIINKHSFLTRIEGLLYQENVPALFVCSVIRFMKCLKSDFKNWLPIFTTLDVWSMLSQYLKPSIVMKKYSKDSRAILYSGKNKKLTFHEDENVNLYEAFALDAISIVQLILESVKKDPNIATIIVRSVPFLENMLKWVAFILHNRGELGRDSSQGICDTLFFSSTTLLHYLLSFTEEDTFRVLCGLFRKTSKIFHVENPLNWERESDKEVEEYDHFWPILIEILDYSEQIEVHYSAVKLIASLIQSFERLAKGENSLELPLTNDEDSTFGVTMCYHFCLLFKKVYFPKKNERSDFSENFKNDICSWVGTLLLNSQSAKVTAIKENLVQKLSQKANDLWWAFRIGSVQKNNSSDKDSRFFERELIRLLKILKNTFHHAGDSLDTDIGEDIAVSSEYAYNAWECPLTVQKLIEIYENVAPDTESPIFMEISEVLWTLWAQSQLIKKCFAMPLKNKKTTGIQIILKTWNSVNPASKSISTQLIFSLLTSLCTSPEIIKKLIKSPQTPTLFSLLPSNPSLKL
jgi:hypothetical protein